MRLFGLIGGTLDQARATYAFLEPFDLSLQQISSVFFVLAAQSAYNPGAVEADVY